MKLLVCIAAHYAPERVQYLEKVISNLKRYQCDIDIIIDTQDSQIPVFEAIENVKLFVWRDLQHPFHLTQMHRRHFKEQIDNYDWFYYCEDDILLPWENFLAYTKKFAAIWKQGHVPSFIRIEERGADQFISDVTDPYKIDNFIWIDQKPYIAFPFPQHYHAFWIAPQWALKQTINADFTKLHDSREKAASYLMWELHRKGLIEVENMDGKFQISPNCYSWHLPANYIDSGMKNGKIKVREVFI